MPQKAADDLLTPEQASEALFGKITAQAVRKRVREGDLRCHWQQRTPGKIFVKRSELLELYREKLDGWKRSQRGK